MKYIVASNEKQARLAAQKLDLSRDQYRSVTNLEQLVGVNGADIVVVGPYLGPFAGDRRDEWERLCDWIKARHDFHSVTTVTT